MKIVTDLSQHFAFDFIRHVYISFINFEGGLLLRMRLSKSTSECFFRLPLTRSTRIQGITELAH